ncbi:MAG: PIN domain-containing protein [Candidatus Woesearchaeota archaeon]
MRLVIDSNILFSALLRNSTTRRLIFRDELILFYPKIAFKEICKHKSTTQP